MKMETENIVKDKYDLEGTQTHDLLKNEGRNGYKKTKLGWIPEEWEVKKLKECSKIDSRSLNSKTEDTYIFKYISLSDIGNGLIKYDFLEEYSYGNAPSRARRIIKKNDILMSTVRPNLKAFAIIENEIENVIVSTGFAVITPLKILDSSYLYNYLFSNQMEAQLYNLVVGSNYPAINSSDVKNLKILLPKIEEQTLIATCLSTWDTAIASLTQLIAKKQEAKKGLMQQLLSGKKRLKGFEGKWEEKKIKDLFKEIKDKNDDEEHLPLSISAGKGFVSQQSKFDKVIAGSSLSNYILLKKGDFAYNKGNSKTYKMGCIYLLENFTTGLVPFVFISFRPKVFTHSLFYKHFFINHGLDRQLKGIISSGARGDGLLNVNKKSFFQLKIPYPKLNEQIAIAQILQTADNEITLLTKKLESIKEQKKGLMQVLLTGKKRLKY